MTYGVTRTKDALAGAEDAAVDYCELLEAGGRTAESALEEARRFFEHARKVLEEVAPLCTLKAALGQAHVELRQAGALLMVLADAFEEALGPHHPWTARWREWKEPARVSSVGFRIALSKRPISWWCAQGCGRT